MLQREAAKNGAAPEKYYGKWPFKRVLGAQVGTPMRRSAYKFSSYPFASSTAAVMHFVVASVDELVKR